LRVLPGILGGPARGTSPDASGPAGSEVIAGDDREDDRLTNKTNGKLRGAVLTRSDRRQKTTASFLAD
jgi:hypothetical protein